MANPDDNNDDYWKQAVDLLTGYILPDRKTLFETLKGNEGIKLMHVRLEDEGGPEYSSGFLSPAGWKTHNTDYTIPFYRPADDSQDVSGGRNLYRYRAYITFLASGQAWAPSGDDVIPDYTKTSEVLKDKGGWNNEGDKLDWDTNPLVRYLYGSKAALWALKSWPHSTHGFDNRGYGVTDTEYVDLLTFTEAAKAFDRVVQFFEESADTVGKWDTENIGEGSDSWDGTSAIVFKGLIHKLARNYEGYADQLSGKGGGDVAVTIDGVTVTSEAGRALAEAQRVLLTQAENLYNAWEAWKAESNPQRWLYDMLQNVRLTLLDTQVANTDIEMVSYGSGPSTTWRNNVTSTAGFRNEIILRETSSTGEITFEKSFGRPSDMNTWKALAQEAVDRWDKSAQDWLSKAGAEAIVAIYNAFKAAEKAFDTNLTDRDKRPLSEISAKAEADAAKKKAEAEAAAAKAEAEKERAEAKAAAEKEKAEAKAERDREKAEAEKEKAEAKAAAEKEKAEAKAEQEAAKAAAEKEKAEAKAEQEREKAEAKAAAEEQRAFALAQNQKAQDEAKKERERAVAQNEADRAEAKAERDAAKAEADAEKAAAKEEQAQAKAEAEREQEAAKAEAAKEKAEAKAEQEAAKAEAEKEKAAAKAEQEAAKAEAEKEREEAKAAAVAEREAAEQDQEQARREALQEKQQARLDAQNAKADAQADYEEQKAEARAERDAALQDADRREAAARQEYEQEKAEAEQQRDQAREDAARERTEARAEYERQLATGTDEDQARGEYDRRIAEIDAAEREAVQRADAAQADAREEYDRAKADAQEERDEARGEAEQARKDAKAEYDRRMADIQAEYDRIGAGGKDIDELIRQRIADLPQPPDLSAYNAGGSAGSAGSAYSSVFNDNLYNQDDLTSALGRPAGDALTGAAAGSSGTGAGSPGMYPPMMRGAGGEGGGSSGERTRTVIEPAVGRSGRSGRPAVTPSADDEEHRVVPRAAQTTSSTPFMPPMGPMGGAGEGRPQTETGDRQRTTWLAEDEDVWGTDEGGAPQALGR
ncbi:AAWKG family protein [Streptomyces sp. NPDC086080]|uniref:AAWKG family protein n=1 Tax=Streptomyces sp. NPDC086080 TaxID=3365748 RepID=UPI0037D4F443